jgi:hypothetical protein
LTAIKWVTISDDGEFAAFFEHLASGWRGWEGELVWTALEDDMAIAATHDGLGHVQLRTTLRTRDRLAPWSASATLVIDAGEDMRSLARRAADFLATHTGGS